MGCYPTHMTFRKRRKVGHPCHDPHLLAWAHPNVNAILDRKDVWEEEAIKARKSGLTGWRWSEREHWFISLIYITTLQHTPIQLGIVSCLLVQLVQGEWVLWRKLPLLVLLDDVNCHRIQYITSEISARSKHCVKGISLCTNVCLCVSEKKGERKWKRDGCACKLFLSLEELVLFCFQSRDLMKNLRKNKGADSFPGCSAMKWPLAPQWFFVNEQMKQEKVAFFFFFKGRNTLGKKQKRKQCLKEKKKACYTPDYYYSLETNTKPKGNVQGWNKQES